jgi:chorismate mutase/prephenate dehydratase
VRLQQEYFSTSGDPNGKPRRTVVVAFQGGEGAYSHLAATRHFGARDAKLLYEGFPSFKLMLEAVKNGMADYAVLPIENSIAGSINENYDLLAKMDLHLVGEEMQRVEHCLIGVAEVPLTKIRRIFSHPVALAQCGTFLGTLTNCHAEAFSDTALSVRRVKDEQDLSQAAIASEEAARVYGLPVLARGIADQKDNFTRMVMVAKERVVYDAALQCKTSLILSTKHEEGALLKVLQTLANHGLNLTKLESRPQPDSPFEYVFYVDFEGNTSTPETQAALDELRACTSFLRVLGSYPARRPS